jgi:glycoside/pentoside/hexuronide:cation symporter, GPH family
MKFGKKVGYAVGDMGISISYFVVGFFFLYYLTDIVGMDPSLAGLAFFIGKLWDGVNDPLMGILSDRTRSRLGRKRVFILFGALPFAVSFVLLWMIPLHAAAWIQFTLAILAMTFYATAYTVVVVPYMALVPIMTGDYDERTQITGIRAALSTIGTIAGGSAALLLSSFTDELVGLRTITIAFGAFSLVALLVAGLSVRGVESGGRSSSTVMTHGWTRYLAVLKDRDVLVLMAVKLLGAVATGSLSAALPYFAQHVLGDRGTSTYGLAAYVAVSAACIPVWNRLSRRGDKRRLLLIGNLVTAAVLLAMGFLLRTGMSVAFYAGCVVLGMAMSSYLLIPYSLVPDLVDVYECRTGERHESVFFGLWITVHQLGISLSGLLIGVALSAFGYDGTRDVQAPAALQAVRIGFGALPGLFFLLTALVLQTYRISRGVYERARLELEARSGPRP